ncbi:hypothetical protein E2C01_000431 [Portunus trituberculatus]|uniref:Ig-like domain-containing protein n=1 Tax=Portunus trituberculatus TaxID=210409 RepID=A0A5B7CJR0_PORTR|nr:hypothetical protein [Portunus trituberculatus]
MLHKLSLGMTYSLATLYTPQHTLLCGCVSSKPSIIPAPSRRHLLNSKSGSMFPLPQRRSFLRPPPRSQTFTIPPKIPPMLSKHPGILFSSSRHGAHGLPFLPPQPRDSGVYECQVSTTPPMSHFIRLRVVGSTINLTCLVEYSPEPPDFIFWSHNNKIISYDSSRGGVTVILEKGDLTTSTLLIQKARGSDSGHYDCSPSNAAPANVTVHVLNARPKVFTKTHLLLKANLGENLNGGSILRGLHHILRPSLPPLVHFSRNHNRYHDELLRVSFPPVMCCLFLPPLPLPHSCASHFVKLNKAYLPILFPLTSGSSASPSVALPLHAKSPFWSTSAVTVVDTDRR